MRHMFFSFFGFVLPTRLTRGPKDLLSTYIRKDLDLAPLDGQCATHKSASVTKALRTYVTARGAV
jgi:hypothetical protein